MCDFVMEAQARVALWREEADKLPLPSMEGERCISPAGIFFQVHRAVCYNTMRVLLSWHLCTPRWTPLGILFRETVVPRAA